MSEICFSSSNGFHRPNHGYFKFTPSKIGWPRQNGFWLLYGNSGFSSCEKLGIFHYSLLIDHWVGRINKHFLVWWERYDAALGWFHQWRYVARLKMGIPSPKNGLAPWTMGISCINMGRTQMEYEPVITADVNPSKWPETQMCVGTDQNELSPR